MPIINASHRCLIKGTCFYNMLLKLENERLVKQIYNVSREHSDGWAGNLKDRLETLGFTQEWADQKPVNLDVLRNRLEIESNVNWNTEVQKNQNYTHIASLKMPKRLNCMLPVTFPNNKCSLISRQRLGTLPLQIELGRWKGVAPDRGLCCVCNSGEVEDEYHFLFECDALADIRETTV